MEMTKELVKAISADIITALAAVGEKHGVTFSPGGGSYDPQTGEAKIAVKARIKGIDPDAERFKILAPIMGLRPEDLGRSFGRGQKRYTVAGMTNGGSVVLRDQSGRSYRGKAEDVQRGLAGEAK